MIRTLQSPAAVLAVAGLTFFATLLVLLGSMHLGEVTPPLAAALPAEDDPSWKFRNPDLDQWITQLKSEREALAVREQQLKEWEARLSAEAREISVVTQAVTRAQIEFDKRVVQLKEQEVINLKKQVKLITGMAPDSAVTLLNSMSDDEATKLLYLMKMDNTIELLDAMSKLGANSARRAAALTLRLRNVMPPTTNSLSANASN